jgi:hypothetical protein
MYFTFIQEERRRGGGGGGVGAGGGGVGERTDGGKTHILPCPSERGKSDGRANLSLCTRRFTENEVAVLSPRQEVGLCAGSYAKGQTGERQINPPAALHVHHESGPPFQLLLLLVPIPKLHFSSMLRASPLYIPLCLSTATFFHMVPTTL